MRVIELKYIKSTSEQNTSTATLMIDETLTWRFIADSNQLYYDNKENHHVVNLLVF